MRSPAPACSASRRRCSTWLKPLTPIVYRGHVTRDGDKLNMRDFVKPLPPAIPLAPLILLVGTSMSAGKTTTARVVVRMLAERGLRVLACKLTGAARYRDILSCLDVGAEDVMDFVDAGLPSTVCPESEYVPALDHLLARMAALEPDVIVAEAGASPLEPYNGTEAYRRLAPLVKVAILCASDPYAVLRRAGGVRAHAGRRRRAGSQYDGRRRARAEADRCPGAEPARAGRRRGVAHAARPPHRAAGSRDDGCRAGQPGRTRRVRRIAVTVARAVPQGLRGPARTADRRDRPRAQHGRRGAGQGRRRPALRGTAARDADAVAAAKYAARLRQQHANRAGDHRVLPWPAARGIARGRMAAVDAVLGERRLAADADAEDPRTTAAARADSRRDR